MHPEHSAGQVSSFLLFYGSCPQLMLGENLRDSSEQQARHSQSTKLLQLKIFCPQIQGGCASSAEDKGRRAR